MSYLNAMYARNILCSFAAYDHLMLSLFDLRVAVMPVKPYVDQLNLVWHQKKLCQVAAEGFRLLYASSILAHILAQTSLLLAEEGDKVCSTCDASWLKASLGVKALEGAG